MHARSRAVCTAVRYESPVPPPAYCVIHDPQVDHAPVSVQATSLALTGLPRSPARRRRRPAAGAAALHGRERRALPGGGRGGRGRRAGLLRARLQVHRCARDLATPVLGGAGPRRPGRLLRVRAHDPAQARPRGRLRARREDRIANLLDASTSTTSLGSVHFVGDRAVDHEGWDIWERGRRSRRGVAPLLRGARRGGRQRPVRHPRPSRPGEGVGARPPLPERDPRFYYEPAVEAIAEVGSRGRGLDRGAAKAGAGDLPGAGASRRCASRRGRHSPSPPTPTSPARRRPRLRGRGRRDAAMGDRADRHLRAPPPTLEPLG